jgi:phospholipid transport system transporter-binding protein
MARPEEPAARLEQGPGGALLITGEMGFATVAQLHAHARKLLEGEGELVIDLAAVDRADSAGLALLVEWTRLARGLDRPIRFVNMPEQMREIAAVSGLLPVLPLA